MFACHAQSVPRPSDTLFVDTAVYDWKATNERGIAAANLGKRKEAVALFLRVLACATLSAEARRMTGTNLALCQS